MRLERPLNRYIDHTLLKPYATLLDLQTLLEEAQQYNFASVCVAPYLALTAVENLAPFPEINVGTVISFPHGNLPLNVKVGEAEHFIKRGIDEIDFVANIGLLKSGRYEELGKELEMMGLVCSTNNVVSKCIIETCYLTGDEKTFMYRALSERTSVNFIKTSTGYGSEGAQLEDVFDWSSRRQETEKEEQKSRGLITFVAKEREPLKIKAAGGIKDLTAALQFIKCGADRLGMSASVKVVEEWNAQDRTFTEGEETA